MQEAVRRSGARGGMDLEDCGEGGREGTRRKAGGGEWGPQRGKNVGGLGGRGNGNQMRKKKKKGTQGRRARKRGKVQGRKGDGEMGVTGGTG